MGWFKDLGDSITGSDQRRAIRESTAEQMGFMQQGLDLFQPQHDFFMQQLPGLNESSSIDGVAGRLGQILNGGALDPIMADMQKRSNASMQSNGLSRSSYAADAAAKLPMDLLMNFENMIRGREMQNTNIGQSASTNMANIYSGMGNAEAQSTMGQAASKRAGIGNILSVGSDLMSGVGAIFSDERLKEHMTVTGKLDGLNVYTWDWNDNAKQYGLDGGGYGFSAQEVKAAHPDLVTMNEDGYFKIDVEGLLERVA